MKFTTTHTQHTQPKAKPFLCHLVSAQVVIQGTSYTVVPYDYDGLGTGFQVIKNGLDETCYNVIHEEKTGINICDCPDYLHRHQGNGYSMCKHARALVELNLLAKPGFPNSKNPRR